jgi:hypothetical protein
MQSFRARNCAKAGFGQVAPASAYEFSFLPFLNPACQFLELGLTLRWRKKLFQQFPDEYVSLRRGETFAAYESSRDDAQHTIRILRIFRFDHYRQELIYG